MPVATRRELLEAGVHFGHQTRRWNPKMRRFLFGERSGIYIIDLEKTLVGLEEAYRFVVELGRREGTVLFVGTKKQAQDVVAEQASRVGMPYVNTRWLGGMLTNFQTISRRLARLRELREMERGGAFDFLPKKEVLRLRHEKAKLERNLGGLQDLERLPDAIFVIDTKKEHIAVTEARKLGLPVIAIVDTNCDPDEVDYIIPGNDDAIRAVSLISRVIGDALDEGRNEGWRQFATRTAAPEPEIEAEPAATPERAVAPVAAAAPASTGSGETSEGAETEAAGETRQPATPASGELEPEPVTEATVSVSAGGGSAEGGPEDSASGGVEADPAQPDDGGAPSESAPEDTART